MSRDWNRELSARVAFIRQCLEGAKAGGVVFGNSGGKDSALVGILCRKAAENVVGLILPCGSSSNFGTDREHALLIAQAFDIAVMEIDLTPVKEQLMQGLSAAAQISDIASININPRLRMATLYAVGQSRGYLVAGTGNRSEIAMGYFTKWGDGAYDLNPIGDLTVTEIYEFLRFLGAPGEVIDKAPSGGLYDGQTDEKELGIAYAAIDKYLLTGEGKAEDIEKIEGARKRNAHKRRMPLVYPGERAQA
jgi:NAD+ synthase